MFHSIQVRGAAQNNLKNINVDIPHQKLSVLTGPSGCGKSSLAFETIYAEGKRKFIESLSTYTRLYMERIQKPKVDSIENLSPTIAIEQRNAVRNSRSTVATTTEIYDYLRLLYARIGILHCPKCEMPVKRETVHDVEQFLLDQLNQKEVFLIAPMKRPPQLSGNDGWKSLKEDLLKKGFSRIFINQKILKIEEMREFPKIKSVPLLVDRIRISSEKKGRICDSLSLCYEMAEGFVNIFEVEKQKWHPFSLHFSCSKDKLEFPEIAPHFFSFNNPYGACPDCHGFGNHLKIDEDLIVPNPTLSLKDGAIDPFTKPSHRILHRKMLDFAQRHKIKTNVPYQNLTNKQKKLLFNGDGIFKGLAGFFERLERKKYKLAVRVFLSRYKNAVLCPTCHGRRLRNETQWVHISKKSIADVLSMTIEDASTFFIGITLAQVQQKLVSDVISQIRNRLDFLLEVGLDYLELSRLSRSLSGGEYQRIQLARQLGSKLTETTYILDEPTIGLHPSDVGNLVTIMKRIRDGGNTLLVVEHEKIVMEAADNILELGPGSGHLGGEIVYSGPLQNMHNTLTASYLRNPNKIPIPKKRRTAHQFLKLNGVSHHNLHNFDVEIPLQSLVCISGVSGSGKTSLIQDTLYRTLAKIFHFTPGNIGKFKTISGHTHLDDVSLLDQRPLSQSQRSNPMTYLKAYDEIRVLFSQTLDARRLSLSPKHFSFNVSGGRCENCHGRGLQVIDMQFLEDMELVCESCHGKKFKSEILDVQYKGKNIDDVLEMTVSEALYFFSHSLPLLRKLSILRDVGLDYLKLGQHISTLSGGEAQRLKIAAELSAKKKNSILYILDEPTTGLHFHDITKLLYVLNRLIDQGHSVLVIEHNLDVLKCADYIIDLGPGGGKHGGRLVACGTPEQIALCEDSLTGKYLKSVITDT